METASEISAVSDDEDSRGKETKKRKANEESEQEEDYVVGIIADRQIDGIFNDPHAVVKFVVGKVGKVKSVRVSRRGMIIVECKSTEQVHKALGIYKFGECPVEVFRLGVRERRKGVVSGVPLTVKMETIMHNVDGVCDAKRLSRFREGGREETTSVCLTFEGDVLPDRIYLDYLCYRVRPFERAPLRCFCCQKYGHVAAVCRGSKTCGRCGKEGCKEECKEEPAKCLHCGGEHHVGSSQCPRKQKEMRVNKIRKGKQGMSYAEAVKKVEGSNETTETTITTQEPKQSANATERGIYIDQKRFLAFIAMVINCSVEIQSKSERIKMILHAAKRFLDVGDVSGEDLDNILREGVMTIQTNGSGM